MRSDEWDGRYADSEFLWTVEPNRFVVQEPVACHPGGLDPACGEGRNAIWLAQRGWRVTAVDFFRGPAQGSAARGGARRCRRLGAG